MPSYVAFLRAINVGGHVVKMERLRALFEELGLERVETFIASGNVIFDARSRSAEALAARIESHLGRELGYEVATMLRTPAQVTAAARARPFPEAQVARALAFNVAFLRRPPPAGAERSLDALRTELDDFRLAGSEVYWLCRVRQSESAFSYPRFEKLFGTSATWRGMKTVERLAARWPQPAPAP